jgi:hypothetical protein
VGERRSVVIIAICIVASVGIVIAWAFTPTERDKLPPVEALKVVTEPADIRSTVDLSHISIATSENYFGHKVRLIHGVLKNISDKPLRAIDVKVVFTDDDGKPIQETTNKAFEVTQKPLIPGTQYRFELGFENLPKNWNYRVPNIDVVKVAY